MARAIVGGVVGGLALWVVGFLFWGTPLAGLATRRAPEAAGAAVQQALAQHLGPLGTGTYVVPDPATNAGTALYGQGPVALVHFNSGGFPVIDAGALTTLLVLAVIAGVVIALAMREIATRGGGAIRAGLMLSIALPLYVRIGDAAGNHLPLGYHAYSLVADVAGFAAAVLVIGRWFLPRAAPA